MEISIERYTQLVKEAHDAKRIKALLIDREAHFRPLDLEDIRLLIAMYGEEEEE